MGKDLHLIRYFSSLVTLSNGKVIKMTNPGSFSCPLAGMFYRGLKNSTKRSSRQIKDEVRKVIEGKVARFGFCDKNRVLWDDGASVPYGASEIISYGLRRKRIDTAVLVCDGAGTVVAQAPQVVQGIGARMHSVLKTSPIPQTIMRLRCHGAYVCSDKAHIDQTRGVVEAARLGYKRIAVTVNSYKGEKLKKIRSLEKQYGISVIIMAICTTGIGIERIREIRRYADMVWGCGSVRVRRVMHKCALKSLSKASPVYCLTERGVALARGYRPNLFKLRKELKKICV